MAAAGYVARNPDSSYTIAMEVQFTPEIEARIAERAARQCLSPDEALRDVVTRYFQEEDRFVEAVQRGEAALARGESLTHDQVGDRLRRFLVT
jgi:predicted transcriptional regulator